MEVTQPRRPVAKKEEVHSTKTSVIISHHSLTSHKT